jgi:formylglycine-generating enzyme required for sulfatase activity
MMVVPAGHFRMGSQPDEPARERPQHEVKIAKVFAVGRFAITRGEFKIFARETNHKVGDKCETFEDGEGEARVGRSFENPGFDQDDRHPVVCVNWADAKAFAAWLSKKTTRAYRLLTEAEREYATRAGSTTLFSFGNDEQSICRYANVLDQTAKNTVKGIDAKPHSHVVDCDDKFAYTSPVDQFIANAFGIHDVHGNVIEWTEDCWHDNFEGAPADGTAWRSDDCAARVARGGAWGFPAAHSAARFSPPSSDARASILGFRLARTLDP